MNKSCVIWNRRDFNTRNNVICALNRLIFYASFPIIRCPLNECDQCCFFLLLGCLFVLFTHCFRRWHSGWRASDVMFLFDFTWNYIVANMNDWRPTTTKMREKFHRNSSPNEVSGSMFERMKSQQNETKQNVVEQRMLVTSFQLLIIVWMRVSFKLISPLRSKTWFRTHLNEGRCGYRVYLLFSLCASFSRCFQTILKEVYYETNLMKKQMKKKTYKTNERKAEKQAKAVHSR